MAVMTESAGKAVLGCAVLGLSVLMLFCGCKQKPAPQSPPPQPADDPNGGGTTMHTPPEYILSGVPVKLQLEVGVFGAINKDAKERYTDIVCHYKIAGQENPADLPMTLSQDKGKEAVFECTLPGFAEKDGNSVEYYFDMRFDGDYIKNPVEVIPIFEKTPDPNQIQNDKKYMSIEELNTESRSDANKQEN